MTILNANLIVKNMTHRILPSAEFIRGLLSTIPLIDIAFYLSSQDMEGSNGPHLEYVLHCKDVMTMREVIDWCIKSYYSTLDW